MGTCDGIEVARFRFEGFVAWPSDPVKAIPDGRRFKVNLLSSVLWMAKLMARRFIVHHLPTLIGAASRGR